MAPQPKALGPKETPSAASWHSRVDVEPARRSTAGQNPATALGLAVVSAPLAQPVDRRGRTFCPMWA